MLEATKFGDGFSCSMWLVTITEVARKSNEIPLLSGKHRRLIDTYASHGEETRLQTYQGACGFLEDEH